MRINSDQIATEIIASTASRANAVDILRRLDRIESKMDSIINLTNRRMKNDN